MMHQAKAALRVFRAPGREVVPLRLREVREIGRLVGECRDPGHSPALWLRHALEGLSRLFDATVAYGGEALRLRDGNAAIRVLSACAVGTEASPSCWLSGDPLLRVLLSRRRRLVTCTRRELVSNWEWSRHRRSTQLDDELISVHHTSPEAISVLSLHRRVGAPDFSARERRLLGLFHGELGRLVGGPLISAAAPYLAGLSPRLRQTLACLLDGDCEKQVAARLALSHATVHQYIKTLYRHFGVHSRAELMVHAMKRAPASDPPEHGSG